MSNENKKDCHHHCRHDFERKKKEKKTPIIKLISANHGNQKIKLINLYLTVNVI